jgi:multidrug efflux pump subunit AcrA (membrane-fusion protein)
MKSALLWMKAHKVLVGIIVLALAFLGYKFYPKAPVSPYETVKVLRADLIQEVSVTGKVESEESVDLDY